MEKEDSGNAGLIAFLTNVFLFIIKLAAGLLSGSLAILSDAFNSFLDILSYFLAFLLIRIARKAPDREHPFGHRRAEPISALIIAIFTGILAFEILRAAADNILFGEPLLTVSPLVFGIVVVSIIVKIASYFYLRSNAKKSMSSTLEALALDSRNDVFASSIVLLGVAGAHLGFPILDDVAALFIAAYVLHSGYCIARKNLDYLMGASPDSAIVKRIAESAKSVEGVVGLTSIRAHYVGDRVHAEVSVLLDKKTKAPKTHEIGVNVQKAVEKIEIVEHAFIHIDYK